MNIENTLKKLVDTTVSNLLEGKFKLTEIGHYTSTVEYNGDELKIWACNGVDGCSIYNSIHDFKFPKFETDEIKAAVFALATTPTVAYYKVKLAKAKGLSKSAASVHESSKKDVEALEATIHDMCNVDKQKI